MTACYFSIPVCYYAITNKDKPNLSPGVCFHSVVILRTCCGREANLVDLELDQLIPPERTLRILSFPNLRYPCDKAISTCVMNMVS